MLVRFSCRAIGAPQRLAHSAAAATAPFLARRWQSTDGAKPEAPKTETKAEEPAKPAAAAAAPPAAIAALEAKLKLKEEEAATLKKELMYALADAENARRIGRDDAAKARDFSVSGFGKDMLDVSDTLENAVSAFSKLPKEDLETNKILAAIFTGVKMSSSVLIKNMGKHGIEKMECKVGNVFDPNKHDALFTAPATAEVAAGQIASVVKAGYMLRERVLRAAQVGVAQESKSD